MAKNTFKRIRAHHLDRFDEDVASRPKGQRLKQKTSRPNRKEEWDDE